MLIIYTIGYFLSLLFYYFKHNFVASILMILLAIFLYYVDYKKTKRIINVRGLFALGFVGGFGISLLKLSVLSSDYSLKTIITVYTAYFSLYLGTYFCRDKGIVIFNVAKKTKPLSLIVVLLTAITFITFWIEVYILKFIPLFTKDTPHAYSTFHVFMLHYITSLYIFIPSFAIANYYMEGKNSKVGIICSYVYVVALAMIMVSRSQLIMSLVLSIFTFVVYNKNYITNKLINKKNVCLTVIAIIVLMIIYVFITINRAHDIAYLNGIFEMKNENTPIFITQPYMYIAHNFENLNYMINNIEKLGFGFGRRCLLPLFTLTFVKKIFPTVAMAPTYVIKEELSTLTLIYDFYYDFGIIGVIVFCFIIGYVGKMLENYVYKLMDEKYHTYLTILFSLLCYYMLFSFFQTYFSLTETLVYIIILIFIEGIFVVKNIK